MNIIGVDAAILAVADYLRSNDVTFIEGSINARVYTNFDKVYHLPFAEGWLASAQFYSTLTRENELLLFAVSSDLRFVQPIYTD